jgi:hypothetical protein
MNIDLKFGYNAATLSGCPLCPRISTGKIDNEIRRAGAGIRVFSGVFAPTLPSFPGDYGHDKKLYARE